MGEKEEALQEAKSLLEMYKAGFLDGYSTHKKPKNEKDYKLLNKFYKMAFVKRFAKKVDKVLKKKKK